MNGDSDNTTVINPADGKVIGTIDLGGGPEFAMNTLGIQAVPYRLPSPLWSSLLSVYAYGPDPYPVVKVCRLVTCPSNDIRKMFPPDVVPYKLPSAPCVNPALGLRSGGAAGNE